jgi:hypothetical protein
MLHHRLSISPPPVHMTRLCNDCNPRGQWTADTGPLPEATCLMDTVHQPGAKLLAQEPEDTGHRRHLGAKLQLQWTLVDMVHHREVKLWLQWTLVNTLHHPEVKQRLQQQTVAMAPYHHEAKPLLRTMPATDPHHEP